MQNQQQPHIFFVCFLLSQFATAGQNCISAKQQQFTLAAELNQNG